MQLPSDAFVRAFNRCAAQQLSTAEFLSNEIQARTVAGIRKWLYHPMPVICDPACSRVRKLKREKGIWWMPWRQEAMKDVARCAKPRGAASRL